jgi:CPA2 family monovalent cation:H+ antiporter-2
VVKAVTAAAAAKPSDGPSIADKVRHAVRHTFITKHLVNLFIKNMSAHEK